MPFLSATGDVSSLLNAGALNYARNLLNLGYTPTQVVGYLRARYTPIGGQPFHAAVYTAIVNRAESALASGAQLQRKRSNIPLTREQHTGTTRISEEYQYTVVVEFRDPNTGRRYSRPIVISSANPMGKDDLLGQGQVFARLYLMEDSPTLGAAAKEEHVLTGRIRVTEALVRI